MTSPAYINLSEHDGSEFVSHTVEVIDGALFADYNQQGFLVGIELLEPFEGEAEISLQLEEASDAAEK